MITGLDADSAQEVHAMRDFISTSLPSPVDLVPVGVAHPVGSQWVAMNDPFRLLYEEGPNRSAAKIPALILAAGLALFGLGVFADASTIAFVGVVAIVFGAIAMMTILGVANYSKVQVTQSELSVGKDAVLLSKLDHGLLTSGDLPSDVVASASRIRPGSALFGGAWGIGAGQQVVAVRRADNELLVFGCRKPDRLAEAIARANS